MMLYNNEGYALVLNKTACVKCLLVVNFRLCYYLLEQCDMHDSGEHIN